MAEVMEQRIKHKRKGAKKCKSEDEGRKINTEKQDQKKNQQVMHTCRRSEAGNHGKAEGQADLPGSRF